MSTMVWRKYMEAEEFYKGSISIILKCLGHVFFHLLYIFALM